MANGIISLYHVRQNDHVIFARFLSQNWIGGATISDAAFVPPHHTEVPDLLRDLEAFWHNDEVMVPHLIRCAISHYQFETIHPFLDGNGRIGRLLITLYLVSHDLLKKPSLYLSAHFEKHRAQYYDALSRVRTSNDLGHWCRFFLEAVIATAESGQKTFRNILDLKREMDEIIAGFGRRAPQARQLILNLYKDPRATVADVGEALKVNFHSANKLVDDFVTHGLLKEVTGNKRNRVFVFDRYLKIFGDGNEEV